MTPSVVPFPVLKGKSILSTVPSVLAVLILNGFAELDTSRRYVWPLYNFILGLGVAPSG